MFCFCCYLFISTVYSHLIILFVSFGFLLWSLLFIQSLLSFCFVFFWLILFLCFNLSKRHIFYHREEVFCLLGCLSRRETEAALLTNDSMTDGCCWWQQHFFLLLSVWNCCTSPSITVVVAVRTTQLFRTSLIDATRWEEMCFYIFIMYKWVGEWVLKSITVL